MSNDFDLIARKFCNQNARISTLIASNAVVYARPRTAQTQGTFAVSAQSALAAPRERQREKEKERQSGSAGMLQIVTICVNTQ